MDSALEDNLDIRRASGKLGMPGPLSWAVRMSAGQPAGFELQMLGSFSLRCHGVQITLPISSRRLLAFLAIHGPTSRLVLMGTLWPSVGESHARGSLRTAKWRLQRAAPLLLEAEDDAIALTPDVRVDLRTVADSAQLILQRPDPVSADGALVRAWGELLPGWYDDWVIFERERLRQLRLHALDALAERFAARGAYLDALAVAIESLRIEPLRESANRMIIAIHLAEGNVVEAMRHYRFFRDLLSAELGIEPSPQLFAGLPASIGGPVRSPA